MPTPRITGTGAVIQDLQGGVRAGDGSRSGSYFCSSILAMEAHAVMLSGRLHVLC